MGGEETSVAGMQLADAGLAEAVADGLKRVEDLLHREVQGEYRFVTETALHLIDAGGKRFRPLFTLLAAQVGPHPERDEVVTAAAVVELIHLATLYHDDVMDAATMRRGAESANSRWDNSIAILTGDFLFAHASRLVAELGPDAVRIVAETFAELVTGQMRETRGPREADDPVDHYLRVIDEKTGSLIATSGRFGGMFARAAPEHVEALRRFGDLIGSAFQISDDIIDIASPSGDSGKTPGTDLREGVHTLPVLYALRDAGSYDGGERLRDLLSRPLDDDGEVEEALSLLRAGDGLEQARQTVAGFAQQARTELDALPACPAVDALRTLVDYTVERTG